VAKLRRDADRNPFQIGKVMEGAAQCFDVGKVGWNAAVWHLRSDNIAFFNGARRAETGQFLRGSAAILANRI